MVSARRIGSPEHSTFCSQVINAIPVVCAAIRRAPGASFASSKGDRKLSTARDGSKVIGTKRDSIKWLTSGWPSCIQFEPSGLIKSWLSGPYFRSWLPLHSRYRRVDRRQTQRRSAHLPLWLWRSYRGLACLAKSDNRGRARTSWRARCGARVRRNRDHDSASQGPVPRRAARDAHLRVDSGRSRDRDGTVSSTQSRPFRKRPDC